LLLSCYVKKQSIEQNIIFDGFFWKSKSIPHFQQRAIAAAIAPTVVAATATAALTGGDHPS